MKQPPLDASLALKLISSNLIFAALIATTLTLHAEEVRHSLYPERYAYVLEQGDKEPVCEHMTDVFNTHFKTPWDGGHLDTRPGVTVFGVPYDKVFERMPGVEHDPRMTFAMRLSRFPSSMEFEVLHWLEGRVTYPDTHGIYPVLIAHWIPKDGSNPFWIVKTTFMDRMTTNEGWGQSDGGFDTLEFVSDPDFNPTVPLDASFISHPAWQSGLTRSLGRETARQLRPFIFSEQLYIAAYQSAWHEAAPSYEQARLYPDEEFMNILRLLPGSIPGKYVDIANTEIVCRIRMLMQPTTSKGVK